MSRWADLENSIAARVATEPTFLTVQSAANAGLISIGNNGWPAVVITVRGGKTILREPIAGALNIIKHVEFECLIGTRLSGAAGESRLLTGGVWDLYDKLQAKLLGFTPTLGTPPNAIFPCVEEDFYLDRLEPGAVDLYTLWSCDVVLQTVLNP